MHSLGALVEEAELHLSSPRDRTLQSLAQDLQYGLRSLRRVPGFTLIAVVTLALGIGANTALFSVVNGVLLNPLPFPQPDQLVALHESKPNFEHGSISYPNFLDWQRENRTFSSIAIFRGSAFSLTGVGDAQQVNGEFISSEFFRLLGVRPLAGRTLLPGEDRIGAAPVALLNESVWRRKFGARPDVLGKTLTLDGRAYTVVGIIPASFQLFASFRSAQVYVPLGQWTNPLLANRGAGLGFHGVGRLKPGVSLEQARTDLSAVTRGLAAAFPDADKGISAAIIPLKQQLAGDVQPFLLVLLGAVGFVLLIACVNVANLLLARSTARAREFAIRAALGASRGRVVRQLATESVLLAIFGGSLGLLLALWGTRAALVVLPAALPRVEQVGFDVHVLFFTLAVSLAAGILPGLTPALLRTSELDAHNPLKEGGRGATSARHKAQSAFVVVEMALALVLLIGVGLMLRSLEHLWRVDPGFDPRNVLTIGHSLPPSMTKAPAEAIRNAFRQLEDKWMSVPGVEAVSLTWGALPMGSDDEQLFWLAGEPKPGNENDMHWAIDYIVGPGYLKTMGIPVRHGRFFTTQDNEHAPAVAVVDDVFARKFFPHRDPIGQRLNMNSSGVQVEIVGVVQHVKQWGLDSDDRQSLRAEIYLPCMQMPDAFISTSPGGSAVIRSDGTNTALFEALRQAARQLNAENVLFGAQTMEEIISDSLADRRFFMILLAVFATLALVLASVGIYGVISYVVGERTREIGIRMALGASRSEILRMVLRRGGGLAVMGAGSGLAAALGLTRLMSGLLYGVSATDAVTFGSVAVLLTLVALGACCLPARRATKVDPMVALRCE
jgi:predicted permease